MARPVYIFFLLLVVGLLVYIPILNTGFFSDDFVILNRIQNANFDQGSFFRPLSDVSIYLDYLIWGKNAVGFHITSVLLHILTAWLIYFLIVAITKYLNIPADNRPAIAITCAFLFLIYPFHNEPVVWIVGRGILLASFFAVLSFLLYLKDNRSVYSVFASAILYFLALLSYESVIIFPLILLATELASGKLRHQTTKTVAKLLPFIAVLAVYLFVRWYSIGNLVGSSVYFRVSASVSKMIMNFFRLAERTVLPPLENYKVAITLALTVFTVACFMFYAKRKTARPFGRLMLWLAVCYLVALLPVLTIGISTHTSEGERFLYFPSVFFTGFAGVAVFALFKNFRYRTLIFLGMAAYFLYFVAIDNRNWKQSDKIIKGILNNHQQYLTDGKVYIIDMPDNVNGAFVFRNGFYQAFQFYEMPVVSNSQLKILTWSHLNGSAKKGTQIHREKGVLHINSHITMKQQTGQSVWTLHDDANGNSYRISPNDKVFYFDGNVLRQLSFDVTGI